MGELVRACAAFLRVRVGHAVGAAVGAVVDHGGHRGGEVVATGGPGHRVESLESWKEKLKRGFEGSFRRLFFFLLTSENLWLIFEGG